METLQSDPTPTPPRFDLPLLALLKSEPTPKGVWVAPEIPGSLLQLAAGRFLLLEEGEIILALTGRLESGQSAVDCVLTSRGFRFPLTEALIDGQVRKPASPCALFPYGGSPDQPKPTEKGPRGILLLNGSINVLFPSGAKTRDFVLKYLIQAESLVRAEIEVKPASEADRAGLEDRLRSAVTMTDKVREFQKALRDFLAGFIVTKQTVAVPVFVVACITVFVIMALKGVSAFQPNLPDLVKWGANLGPAVLFQHEYWRLFTCMFIHIGLPHLLMNMYALATSGPMVERMFGRFGFVVLYVFSGLIGSMTSLWLHPFVVSAGASGAIFGVFGGLMGLFLIRRKEIPLFVLKPMTRGFGVFLVANLALGLAVPNIDMAAHGGGLVAGILCGILFGLASKLESRRRPFARLGVAALLAAATFAFGYATIRMVPTRHADALKGFVLDPLGDFEKYNDGLRGTLSRFDEIQKGIRAVQADGKITVAEKPVLEELARRAENLVSRAEQVPAKNPDLKEMKHSLESLVEHQRASLAAMVAALGGADPTELVKKAQDEQSAIKGDIDRLAEERERYFAKHGLKFVQP